MKGSGGRNLILLFLILSFGFTPHYSALAVGGPEFEDHLIAYYEYAEEEPDQPQGPVLWQSILRLALVLPLVLILAYLTSRCIARHSGVSNSGSAIEILAVKQLNKNNYLFLLEIGGKILLVGSSPETIESLAEFGHDDFDTDELTQQTPSFESAFQKQLSTKLKALKNLKGKADQNEDE